VSRNEFTQQVLDVLADQPGLKSLVVTTAHFKSGIAEVFSESIHLFLEKSFYLRIYPHAAELRTHATQND
jgi:hypothetical protein